MNECLQLRYNPFRVAEEPLRLKPPLRVGASFDGAGFIPLIRRRMSYLWLPSESTLVAVDHTWNEVWRCPATTSALEGDTVIVASDRDQSLSVLDGASGAVLWSTSSRFGISAFLPGQRAFLSATRRDLGPMVQATGVALVSFRDAVHVSWEAEEITDYQKTPRSTGYDWDVACDASRVFVGRGSTLIALDLKTGGQLWSASVEGLGGPQDLGKWVPMVSEGSVVINTLGGTAAFDVRTGRLTWFFPHGGGKVVYEGRVYFVTRGIYHVLDLQSGRSVVECSLADNVRRTWGWDSFDLATYAAVSETHLFGGDANGRLYAFDRHTGEAVWTDRPDGIGAFSGNVPTIVNERLYVSDLGYSRVLPSRMWCFEQA